MMTDKEDLARMNTRITELEEQSDVLLEALGNLLYLAAIKDPTEKERVWSKAEQTYRQAKEK